MMADASAFQPPQGMGGPQGQNPYGTPSGMGFAPPPQQQNSTAPGYGPPGPGYGMPPQGNPAFGQPPNMGMQQQPPPGWGQPPPGNMGMQPGAMGGGVQPRSGPPKQVLMAAAAAAVLLVLLVVFFAVRGG